MCLILELWVASEKTAIFPRAAEWYPHWEGYYSQSLHDSEYKNSTTAQRSTATRMNHLCLKMAVI